MGCDGVLEMLIESLDVQAFIVDATTAFHPKDFVVFVGMRCFLILVLLLKSMTWALRLHVQISS